jgi:hypothetical protein
MKTLKSEVQAISEDLRSLTKETEILMKAVIRRQKQLEKKVQRLGRAADKLERSLKGVKGIKSGKEKKAKEREKRKEILEKALRKKRSRSK